MSNITLPFAELYTPIEGSMARVVGIIDEELRSDLPFVNELCRTVQAYRGKMLRPALLLLTAEGLGGRRDEHATLAAVVEMVHMATLVHDDVLDEADMRRRQPTINAMNGNEAAVMLGDYLISHAFHLCSGVKSQYASRLVGQATNVVCEGELLQIYHRGNFGLSEGEYFEIIRKKTAALTSAACVLGAKFAGSDEATIRAMERFGTSVGVAFQIVDDILDLVGDERKMGKTIGRDADLGKLTLPLIHHLDTAGPSMREAAVKLLRSTAPGNRSSLAARLRSTGSIDYAVSVASEYVKQALSEIGLLPETPARASLAAMTEFILRRDL